MSRYLKQEENSQNETKVSQKVDRLTKHTRRSNKLLKIPSWIEIMMQTARDFFCQRKSPCSPFRPVLPKCGKKTLKQSVNLPSGHFEVDHYTKISTTFSTNLMQNFMFNTKPTWNYPNQFNDSNGFRKVWNFLMDFQVAWWMHALIIQTHNNCE